VPVRRVVGPGAAARPAASRAEGLAVGDAADAIQLCESAREHDRDGERDVRADARGQDQGGGPPDVPAVEGRRRAPRASGTADDRGDAAPALALTGPKATARPVRRSPAGSPARARAAPARAAARRRPSGPFAPP